jgi:glycosyltransferase involved in cell wall biosynthesis
MTARFEAYNRDAAFPAMKSGVVVTTPSAAPLFADRRSSETVSADESTNSPPVAPLDVPPGPALTVLILVPTLEAGAADAGAVQLVRILARAGHMPIVASRGGRLADEVAAAGGACVTLDAASRNPLTMLRNAIALIRIIRERRCDLVHAHGRAPAWSGCLAARITGRPFVTTWYKGFREQNALKRLYNGVMAYGDRVIAVSDQLAELIHDRYGTPWDRIAVVPSSIDLARFDPATVSHERVKAVRRDWGVSESDRVVLVIGRMLRRKGHHVAVRAAGRLKAMGLKDFVCVFAAEDKGTRYAAEVWDQVQASGTNDVIRMAGPIGDLPAAYLAAEVAVSAAVQPEGVQRALLEAQAMARPVIVSDAGAGRDVVLAPPAVTEDRMTGIRFSTGDDAALAAALIRLFSMTDSARRAIGLRGRSWMIGHFSQEAASELTLKLYADLAGRRRVA